MKFKRQKNKLKLSSPNQNFITKGNRLDIIENAVMCIRNEHLKYILELHTGMKQLNFKKIIVEKLEKTLPLDFEQQQKYLAE